MRFLTLIALGACQAAAVWSGNSTATNGEAVEAPSQVGDSKYHGCVPSGNMETFEKVAVNDQKMNLDLCAASCSTRSFAVKGGDCFCSNQGHETKKIAESACNVPCPGNKAHICGGEGKESNFGAALAAQRFAISVYTRPPTEDYDSQPTTTASSYGGSKTSSSETMTSTVTRTITGTITACPPHVLNCPIGSQTTTVVVETTTHCPTPEWHKNKIVCYGDFCAPEHYCPDCGPTRVVCLDGGVCHVERVTVTEIQEVHRLVFCTGGDCRYRQCQGDEFQSKLVCSDGQCTLSRCLGDECQKKFVCRGDNCKHEQCQGDECHKKYICVGEQCKHVQLPCSGVVCPAPPPSGKYIVPGTIVPGVPIKPTKPVVSSATVPVGPPTFTKIICPGNGVEYKKIVCPDSKECHGETEKEKEVICHGNGNGNGNDNGNGNSSGNGNGNGNDHGCKKPETEIICPGGKGCPPIKSLVTSLVPVAPVETGSGLVPPGSGTGVVKPDEGGMVQVGGSEKRVITFNLLGAATGLALML